MRDGPRLPLGELVGALSLAADLSMGQPMEHGLRTCLLAVSLAREVGLDADTVDEVCHVALLRWAGCTANAHETASLLGDDIGMRGELLSRDQDGAAEMLGFVLANAGRGLGAAARARTVARVLGGGARAANRLVAAHCEVAQGLATRLGLSAAVQTALGQVFERWDGRGGPAGLLGEEIPVAVRVVTLAGDAEIVARTAGPAAAAEVAGRRAGRIYDPALVGVFCRHVEAWWGEASVAAAWEVVQTAVPKRILTGDELDRALGAIAHFVDLKSPFTVTHSTTVAELAGAGAQALGLPAAQIRSTRWAGLVHDLGRAAVSNSVWDKPGPLTFGEWEEVRLHPYYTERTLSRSSFLAELAAVAVAHHERVDGTGYPHHRPAGRLSPAARVLAAADAYAALIEPRPHRPACSPSDAAGVLRQTVRTGGLAPDAVGAVLDAAGHRASVRPAATAGLTTREVEVLGLLARGLTNRQIAAHLTLSPKTVGRHIEHVYAKLHVTTRAGATLFALQNHLVPDTPSER